MKRLLITQTILLGLTLTWSAMTSTTNAGEPENRLASFMKQYQDDYKRMYCDASYTWWDAMITGSEESFSKSAEASLAITN